MKSIKDIQETCENFLQDWDRQAWMEDHGHWASEDWEVERYNYKCAVENLKEAVDKLSSEDVDEGINNEELVDLAKEVVHAAKHLEEQVLPDSDDYISEGDIDPDNVSNSAIEIDDVGESWEGWDCQESWYAYRVEDALYIRWRRIARGLRHERDLWVIVDEFFFEEEEEEESKE
jgi:hypothetical protein